MAFSCLDSSISSGGGVLLVGLDLVQAPLQLGALGADDLEVLLLAAQLLAGGVEARLDRLDLLAGLGQRGLEALDLLGQPRRLRVQRGDPRVVPLELNQCLQLRIHVLSIVW